MKHSFTVLILMLLFSINSNAQLINNNHIHNCSSNCTNHCEHDNPILKSDTPFTSKNSSSSNEPNTILNHSGEDNIIPEIVIDKSCAVGEIPITSSVSPLGAKCYNVPLYMTPGRQGLQPDLSLSYNSQHGNGLLGVGWNLNGLSSIVRVNKNIFYDNFTDIVNFNAQDALELDGNRLLKKSTSHSMITYETSQGNTTIEAYYTGDIIKYFKAYYPDGSVGIFGFESNTVNKHSYPLTLLTDAQGNNISFLYFEENDVYYIAIITYGGRINSNKDLHVGNFTDIVFVHEERPDKISAFTCGKDVGVKKRLSSIRYYLHIDPSESNRVSKPIRMYNLTYDNVSQESRLRQINCLVGNEKLNPINLYYGDKTKDAILRKKFKLPGTDFDAAKVNLLRGKFDPNSIDDALVTYPKMEMYRCDDENTKFYSTIYPEEQDINVYQNLKADENPSVSTIKAGKGLVGVLFANIDGTGKDKLIKINNEIQSSNNQFYEAIKFSIFNSDVISGTKREETLFLPAYCPTGVTPTNLNSCSIIPRDLLVGSFTGKGHTEIMMIPKYFYPNYAQQNNTYIVSLANVVENVYTGPSLFRAKYDDKILTMDVDGDGQTEILRVSSNNTTVYKYKGGNGFVEVGHWSLSLKDFATRQILFADLNGDGNIDIIKSPLAQKVVQESKVIRTAPDWFKRVNKKGAFIKCKNCRYILRKVVRDHYHGNPVLRGKIINYEPYIVRGDDGIFIDTSDLRYTYRNIDPSRNICFPQIEGDSVKTVCPGCQTYFGYKIPNWNGEQCFICDKWCRKHDKYMDISYWLYKEKFDRTINDRVWIYEYTDGRNIVRHEEISGTERINAFKYSIHETNGDDVPDLIIQEVGTTKTHIIPFNIANNSFDYKNEQIQIIEALPGSYEYADYDINSGHKYSSLLAYGAGELHQMSFTHNHTRCNMLSAMVNSLGVVDKTDYSQFVKSHGPLPPAFSELISPMWVASQTSVLLNNKIVSDKSYTYDSPYLHKYGLGFCGFASVKTTDLLSNKSITTEYDPTRLGVITKQISDIGESEYNYKYEIASNKKITLTLTSKYEKDKLKGNMLISLYPDYDGYGNPLTEFFDYGNGSKTTITRTYENRVTNSMRLIGMPSSVLSTTERDWKKSTEKIIYKYNDLNQVESITKSIGDGVKLTPLSLSEYNYDPNYGTLSQSSVTNLANNDKLTTNYNYDRTGLLRSQTDAMGLTTNYDYDKNRLLTSQTDYLGNKTSWSYDIWRRKITEISPDGVITNTKQEWCNDDNPNNLIKQTTTSTGQPAAYAYFDALGREQRSVMVGFDGTEVITDKTYDKLNRLESSSNPYKAGETASKTSYLYDEYDRIVNVTQPGGSTTAFAYEGNTVTETKDGVVTSKTTDSAGQLISSTDAGGTVTYTYRADGKPDVITANNNQTLFEYDDPYFRQTKLSDPSAGDIKTAYNDTERSVTQTMNSGKSIKSTFNKLGQLILKETEDMNASYLYENSKIKTIQINSLKIPNDHLLRNFTYDSFDRIKMVSETKYGKEYKEAYKYKDGKIQSIRYEPIGYTVYCNYNNFGYLDKLKDRANHTIREVRSVNAFGQETEVGFGNGLTTGYSYTTEGLIKNIKTFNASKSIQDMNFDVNSATGILNSRTSKTNNVNNPILNENFTYGDLYRLQTYGPDNNKQVVSYSSNGNIISKSDAGNYAFNAAGKPYTLTAIDNYSNAFNNALSASYNVMSRPDTLKLNNYSAFFKYDDNYDRTFAQIKDGDTNILTKYYFANGQYEVVFEGGKEKQRLYLDGSPYSASVIAEKIDGQTKVYYLHRDNLGSITQISNENANLVAEYSYDAWGRMRDVDTWQVYTPGTEPKLLFDRGYTGHEHLPQFGLINMNARLYDPVLGRFISPDPLVSSPEQSNSYNRYIYANNNPLMYVDLDGEKTGDGPIGGPYLPGYGNERPGFYDPNGKIDYPGSYNGGGMGYPGSYNGGDMGSYNSGYSGGGSGWGSLIITGLNWLRHTLFSPRQQSTATVITFYKAPQSTNKKITLAKVETNNGSQTVYSGCRRVGTVVKNFANEAQYYIPVWGACQQSSDAFNNGQFLAGIGYFGFGVFEILTLGEGTGVRLSMNTFAMTKNYVLASSARVLTVKEGVPLYRYMSMGELKAIQKTGYLRGGRIGETYFTSDLYRSSARAQNRLALEFPPPYRVEFRVLNNPFLEKYGSKVTPKFGMPGKGAEFMTKDLVKVELINWQLLK